jgi:hypothetical protein
MAGESGTLTPEQMAARIAELEGRLKISFRVSEKGAVSVYGLGRFPVTLYSNNGIPCCPTGQSSGRSSKTTSRD